jgi:hypothetical protein
VLLGANLLVPLLAKQEFLLVCRIEPFRQELVATLDGLLVGVVNRCNSVFFFLLDTVQVFVYRAAIMSSFGAVPPSGSVGRSGYSQARPNVGAANRTVAATAIIRFFIGSLLAVGRL